MKGDFKIVIHDQQSKDETMEKEEEEMHSIYLEIQERIVRKDFDDNECTLRMKQAKKLRVTTIILLLVIVMAINE